MNNDAWLGAVVLVAAIKPMNCVQRIKGFGVRHHKYLKCIMVRVKLQGTGYWCIASMTSIFQNASLFPEPQQEAILYKRLLGL